MGNLRRGYFNKGTIYKMWVGYRDSGNLRKWSQQVSSPLKGPRKRALARTWTETWIV